ncbi:MAG: glycosyltransferase [Akkermansiaceae bacterium]|nr:glycosyltransferase [Akkermansiaceae bacterium]MDP4646586.1 glycosyltransferase [Akkermansiaceae bacterium]MDP4779795.1 glycosyltransferase [Akkermansiaceae bacterium]MDP4846417.1 glycosyltransferase [Akkermansiaceae bacterium]MDP4896718.1 glycosyltransferase [Akkermansiaceae bacterium]
MPFGSAGDVFPFMWLGKLLKGRGVRVTMIAPCLFEDAAGKVGIDFVGLGTAEEFQAITKDPRIWKLGVGTKVVLDYAVGWTEGYLEAVEGLGKVDLMMAPLTCFGARLAREKHAIPLVTVHLQPVVFMSAYETPLLHPWFALLRMVPVWVKRLLFSLPNPIDFMALPGIRKVCAKHGLTAPKSLWREWWDSPDGVLVLFPEWFGKPQPDWPGNVQQWDFPLEDLGGEMGMQEELEKFLEAGEKPVVFTPGSANVQAERFFDTAVEVVKRLGVRAVFVTRMENRVPEGMGEQILQVDFVPFGRLLEHASVFVHHGGVGTMAQGFRAGVPQLVMAMAHDQPDNAARMEKLGVGIGLTPRSFTPNRVEKELGKLLNEESWQLAAEVVRDRLSARCDEGKLMQWLEGHLEGS